VRWTARLLARAAAAVAVLAAVLGVVMLLEGFAVAVAAHLPWLSHFLAMDTQASPNYDFGSGTGPMVLTALTSSTIIAGLWHGMNCHEPGCYRIGRHKVDGTPWCNSHQGKARASKSTDDLLRELVALLRERQ